MKEILKVENVSKSIKGKKIIDNFSFSIQEGEIVGLLGANGAGKTTIMRMIVGLIKNDAGNIVVDGYSIEKEFIKAIDIIGAVIEAPELYPYLTGAENLRLLSRINGKTNNIEEIIKLVQLEDRINDKVGTYSLGMKQRLGVAQALIHNPKLIILDEPMNGLDPMGVRQLREYLKFVAQSKKVAILISSHILSEMELISNRIIIINEGKKISDKPITATKSGYVEGMSYYKLRIGKCDNIVKIIKEKMVSQLAESEFLIKIKEENMPNFVKALVETGTEVYTIEEHKKNLEDDFLTLVKGEMV